MTMNYNAPLDASPSTIGTQIRTDQYEKAALVEAAKETFFGQLADVKSMPKNMGKKIKQYVYLPMLSDANINDQGIDANGATILTTEYSVQVPELIARPRITEAAEAAFTAAHLDGDVIFITDSAQWLILTADTAIGYNAATAGGASGTELTDAAVAGYLNADIAGGVHTVAGAVITLTRLDLVYSDITAATLAANVMGGALATQRSGNLYGSSKDVGTLTGKLPLLGENGGKVNRVGFKRNEIESTLEKLGFHYTYSAESLNFDSDPELKMHLYSEAVKAANEITEDNLQIDLLNSAGVKRFGGSATTMAEITGDTGSVSVLTFQDFMRLSIDLDNNRCPKNTKMITGSRMIDTRTVQNTRFMYVGSELVPALKELADSFGNQAFISVEKYASAGSVAIGEIGKIDQFTIIVVPEMLRYEGAGATVTANAGYAETGGRYDVYPLLVIGSESFTTIGFQTDGKTSKFKIKIVDPEASEAYSIDNPYGELGFTSIKWYYGFMVLRPERIALMLTVAPF